MMKSLKLALSFFTISGGLVYSGPAQATTIVDIGTVEYYSSSQDDYYVKTDQTKFSTSGGVTTLDVLGNSFTGGPNGVGTSDPWLYLFRDDGNLTADDFVTDNDDSGDTQDDGSLTSLDPWLQVDLAAGNYIAIVGRCCYSFDSTSSDAEDQLQVENFLTTGYHSFSGTNPESGKIAYAQTLYTYSAWDSQGHALVAGGSSKSDYQITISGDGLTPIPAPAALPLLLSALGAFGFFGWQRKRMAAA